MHVPGVEVVVALGWIARWVALGLTRRQALGEDIEVRVDETGDRVAIVVAGRDDPMRGGKPVRSTRVTSAGAGGSRATDSLSAHPVLPALPALPIPAAPVLKDSIAL